MGIVHCFAIESQSVKPMGSERRVKLGIVWQVIWWLWMATARVFLIFRERSLVEDHISWVSPGALKRIPLELYNIPNRDSNSLSERVKLLVMLCYYLVFEYRLWVLPHVIWILFFWLMPFFNIFWDRLHGINWLSLPKSLDSWSVVVVAVMKKEKLF